MQRTIRPKLDALDIKRGILLSALLILAVSIVYSQVAGHGFIYLDDAFNIFKNPRVAPGLTQENIRWLSHNIPYVLWIPRPFILHLLECGLFGPNPGAIHLASLALHAGAATAFFWAFFLLTGAFWKSAVAAALFALHPLAVEPVAWASEQNCVFGALLWALALLAYSPYVRKPGLRRYLPVFIAFALGLFSRGTLMALPCVLLLLDYWPLGRFRAGPFMARRALFLFLEKVPFFLFAAFYTVMSTSWVREYGDMVSFTIAPLSLRIKNALVSCWAYIAKAAWPADLAVFYPYPATVPAAKAALAATGLAAVTALAAWQAKKRPYLIVGWGWFLCVLAPTSGLFMHGAWPAMSDRWAYLPLIGIFVMGTWGVDGVLVTPRLKKAALIFLAALVLPGFMAASWVQAARWKNSETLFSHTLARTKSNRLIEKKFGDYELARGNKEKALARYRAAMAATQGLELPKVQKDLGIALARAGLYKEAAREIQKVIAAKPNDADARDALGVVFFHLKRHGDAEREFAAYVSLKPKSAMGHKHLGDALLMLGRLHEAASEYRQALSLDPGLADAAINLRAARELMKK